MVSKWIKAGVVAVLTSSVASAIPVSLSTTFGVEGSGSVNLNAGPDNSVFTSGTTYAFLQGTGGNSTVAPPNGNGISYSTLRSNFSNTIPNAGNGGLGPRQRVVGAYTSFLAESGVVTFDYHAFVNGGAANDPRASFTFFAFLVDNNNNANNTAQFSTFDYTNGLGSAGLTGNPLGFTPNGATLTYTRQSLFFDDAVAFNIAASGSYTLGFGVAFDPGNANRSGGVAIQDIDAPVVPEIDPSQAALPMSFAFLALLLVEGQRRKRILAAQ